MGINKQSDIEANLQIGPTDIGMVRIYVSAGQSCSETFKKKLATLLSDQYTQPIYYMQY